MPIDPPFSVLHVHGPGGVGKTSLLQALGAIAAGAGATVARLDGRDLDPSPVGVLEALAETLAIPTGDGPIGLPEGGGRLVLLVDAYEHMTALDHWFRARLIPRLPASAIVVIAGRDAPTRAWRGDPAWGALLRVVSLRNLDPGRQPGLPPSEQASTGTCTSGSCASPTGIRSVWRCWPTWSPGAVRWSPTCCPSDLVDVLLRAVCGDGARQSAPSRAGGLCGGPLHHRGAAARCARGGRRTRRVQMAAGSVLHRAPDGWRGAA